MDSLACSSFLPVIPADVPSPDTNELKKSNCMQIMSVSLKSNAFHFLRTCTNSLPAGSSALVSSFILLPFLGRVVVAIEKASFL